MGGAYFEVEYYTDTWRGKLNVTEISREGGNSFHWKENHFSAIRTGKIHGSLWAIGKLQIISQDVIVTSFLLVA